MWHATASTRARRCCCATILAVSCGLGSRWITVDSFQFVLNALRRARCVCWATAVLAPPASRPP